MDIARQMPTSFLLAVWLILSTMVQSTLSQEKNETLAKVEKTFGEPPGSKRLDPVDRIWVDSQKKLLIVDGYVAMRTGQLEMFACPAGTKEHESVVGVFAKAYHVHAGLLAIGAKQGKPVKWEPEYTPATGSEIQIHALWTDKKGQRQSIDARNWVREVGTEKSLGTNWVFAGSLFHKDPDTGEQRYQAESGDLVCVSNFATATLDIPLESSQVNSGLMFAAYTDRIPAEGTPIRLVFQVAATVKPTEGSKNAAGNQGATTTSPATPPKSTAAPLKTPPATKQPVRKKA